MHVLVTRFSSLGDVVIQTSFVNALKASYPNLVLSFLTLEPFVSLIENHPSIDNVYGYKKASGLNEIKALKCITERIQNECKIDYIIDLHGTTRSFLFKFINPAIPALNIDKRRLERFITIHLKLDMLKSSHGHQTRAVNDLKGLIGISLSDAKTSLRLDSEQKSESKKYIVLAPIASFDSKRWPIDYFKQLIILILNDESYNHFDLKIVAGPDDDYVDALNFNEKIIQDRVVNLKGKTTLSESARIIRDSSLIIGNDTGMGHIAESFGVPSIVLFGPTHKSLGFSPYLEDSLSLSENLWCSPCSGTGKKKCFRKEQYCFTQLTPERVFAQIKGVG
jgi:ADP-heptose:LPS heptosyltransferase